jgi:DNA invertase Pin-like site-specific DNA recombinase
MIVKYIRVSTEGQNIDRQKSQIKEFIDICSGSISFKERPQAIKLLNDENITEVHVHSIDRLGRNTLDIMQTIQNFTAKGVNVISDKEGLQTLIEGKENPIAKMMIGILGTLAEFELSRIKERQKEGIQEAKKKGVYIGRSVGSVESVEVFMSKESTKKILKYLKQKESINRTALLSGTSAGTVKKIKKMIKEGEIKL